jgi:hypothetical protein
VLIYGIAATESLDRTGERVMLNGMDIQHVRAFNDEHQSKHCFEILGAVQASKKIYSERDCEDQYQLKCWNLVRKPYLYVYGEIADQDGHPNAQAAAALIKFSTRHPEMPVGFSVEGATLEREGNMLTKTKVVNISLTVKPANTECRVFSVQDLTKSYEDVALPDLYKGAHGRKQFRNVPSDAARILSKTAFIKDAITLSKSQEISPDGVAAVKCWSCGEAKLFVKRRLPNRCVACGEAFSMQDLFKALSSDNRLI